MTTRTGKVARLPAAIRDQLNQRMNDGVPASDILEWLNQLPEVQTVLQEHFKGEAISEMNITRWRFGGYQDWLNHQESLDFFSSLQDTDFSGLDSPAQGGKPPLSAALTDKLMLWLVAQLAGCARSIAGLSNPEERWTRLRELCTALSRLRRCDLRAETVRLQGEWLALGKANASGGKQEELLALIRKVARERRSEKKQSDNSRSPF